MNELHRMRTSCEYVAGKSDIGTTVVVARLVFSFLVVRCSVRLITLAVMGLTGLVVWGLTSLCAEKVDTELSFLRVTTAPKHITYRFRWQQRLLHRLRVSWSSGPILCVPRFQKWIISWHFGEIGRSFLYLLITAKQKASNKGQGAPRQTANQKDTCCCNRRAFESH